MPRRKKPPTSRNGERLKEAPLMACNTRQTHFKRVLDEEDIKILEWMNDSTAYIGDRKFVPTIVLAFGYYGIGEAGDIYMRYGEWSSYMSSEPRIFDRTYTKYLEVKNGIDPIYRLLHILFRKKKMAIVLHTLKRFEKLGLGIFIPPEKMEKRELERIRVHDVVPISKAFFRYKYTKERKPFFSSGFLLNLLHHDKIVKCVTCEKTVKSNDSFRDDTNYYCTPCFDKKFITCLECKKVIKRDGAKEDPREGKKGWFYCDRCYDDKFSVCGNCNNDYLEKSGETVEGTTVCPSCAEESSLCEGCNERFWNTNDDNYCENCAEQGGFTCKYCGEDYESDSLADGFDDVCEKCECLEDIQKLASQSDLTDEEALATVPDVTRRVDAMFEGSAYVRETDLRNIRKDLKDHFPELGFDFKALTLKTNTGKEFKLSYLLRDNWLTKDIESRGYSKEILDSYIQKFYNTREYNVRSSKKTKNYVLKWLPFAIKARIVLEENYPEAKAATDSITGVYDYKVDEDLKFVITKDPIELLSKTTSTCWEALSCEKLMEGIWGNGAFSEIANLGVVVYIVDHTGLRIGRMMLRWCHVDKAVKIGIEEKWYACTARPEIAPGFVGLGTSTLKDSVTFSFVGTDLTPDIATRFVRKILASKDVGMKNKDICKTPYYHGGFSDKMAKGHSKIRFNE